MEIPVPYARARQSRTRCPGAEDIVSKSWKTCGTHGCLHQPTPASTYRLHGLVKTAFGPDPSGITSVIDNSHRFLNRATRNGKHGSISGTGPSAGGRAATPPQTTTHVEISRNASWSHWKPVRSANKTNISGLHAELGDRVSLRNQTYPPLLIFHPLPESLLLEVEGQPSVPVINASRLRPIRLPLSTRRTPAILSPRGHSPWPSLERSVPLL